MRPLRHMEQPPSNTPADNKVGKNLRIGIQWQGRDLFADTIVNGGPARPTVVARAFWRPAGHRTTVSAFISKT